jgi:hypothetical protein
VIFRSAVGPSNHAARSTSGKACRLPERGGHSISKVLLVIADASRSCSIAQASITLPPAIFTGASGMKAPSIA